MNLLAQVYAHMPAILLIGGGFNLWIGFRWDSSGWEGLLKVLIVIFAALQLVLAVTLY